MSSASDPSAGSSPARHPSGHTGKPADIDLLRIDDQLTSDERLVRDTVRDFTADRIQPHIAGWFENGTLPADLMPELGKLGLLGMHLSGYGCAGMGPVAYGVACRELEATDSGLRSMVSVQGSLAMFPIWKYGSEEQKTQWLPRMAAGGAVGCFGLTEPDHGSDPAGMSTRARRDGSDWVLSGTKMWITNGSIADIAVVWAATDDGVRGFLVPRGEPGFSASDIHQKMALRASITSELHFDDVRLPADAMLPGVTGLKGPLSCLSEARSGSSGAPPGRPAPAMRSQSSTRGHGSSSAGRSAASSSPSPSWHGWLPGWPVRSCWRCTSAGSRKPGRCAPTRSAWAR